MLLNSRLRICILKIWLPVSAPLPVALLLAWLGFFGFGWYGPWVAYVAESAPPEKTGFALGLAMAINQVAIVLVPPALGLLRDATHSYLPGWSVLVAMTLLGLLATRRRAPDAMRYSAPEKALAADDGQGMNVRR